ncbi:MAG: DUF120 domain-containing protein [Alphaproteobacteria bacterium]|nr:DUF120 domain-containing protein [Alphaproteobacteria bacterium]
MTAVGALVLSGEVASGKGEGAFFTGAEWARAAFRELVDIDPWPGTLNLRITEPASLSTWAQVRAAPGLRLAAPDPAWCDAKCYLALLAQRLRVAIVLPEVSDYAPDQVEIVSAVQIRETLGVADGDVLRLDVTL